MAHLKLEGVAPDEKDSAVVVAAVQHWLQSHAGWLLIIDNDCGSGSPLIVNIELFLRVQWRLENHWKTLF